MGNSELTTVDVAMHHVFASMNDSLNGDFNYIGSVLFVSKKKKGPQRSLFDPDLLLLFHRLSLSILRF